jgi:tetratricopeptide (TPR) repeat protein
VWNRAWELMAERVDEIAQDDEQTLRAMLTFGVEGLTAEQLGLLVRMAQACVEANPDSPKAFSALGRVHIRRHDYQAAQAAFERQIELARRLDDPIRTRRWQAAGFFGLAWVWDHLARQAEEAGDKQAATAAAERVVEYGSNARDLDREAEAYRQGMVVEGLAYLGREEEALREIQRYLRTMEAAGKRPIHGKIGNALDLLGRREEALEYDQRAVAAAPLLSSRLRGLGSDYQALGHHEEAAFWWARAQGLRKTAGPRTQPWLPPA